MNIFNCPNCDGFIEIEQYNCNIFRHAIFKDNFKQIGPHTPEKECNDYLLKQMVYGCCKPFKIITENNTKIAVKCDYI